MTIPGQKKGMEQEEPKMKRDWSVNEKRAGALRENLLKRKAQARARQAGPILPKKNEVRASEEGNT